MLVQEHSHKKLLVHAKLENFGNKILTFLNIPIAIVKG